MFTSMPNPDLYAPLARIIDDEETVRNSEAFMLRMGGINAVVYESAEEFLARDDLRHPGCRKLEVRSALELHHYLSAIGELAEDQKAPEDREFTDD